MGEEDTLSYDSLCVLDTAVEGMYIRVTVYRSVSPYLATGRHLGLDDIDDSWLGQRAQVAQLVALTSDDLAHDATHDLQGAVSICHV